MSKHFSPEIKDWIRESISTKEKMLADQDIIKQIEAVASLMSDALMADKKILVCGNGGSAGDSGHFVGELLNRFTIKRDYPLPAIDLSAFNSTITAIANDYSFEFIFSKQVEALGKRGDILFAMSTSGNSLNVRRAIEKALDKNMIPVILTGSHDLRLSYLVRRIIIPSKKTPIIQEASIMVMHIICDLIDKVLV